ncbi:ABC transporter substrate-binding protein, partial [Staphylococcus pseudintermedius]|uniref:ABC transporter substrate-binding protein n=1 Tax=Staphylococcus pseudintermedius TaxID=283734 RepID=UPI0028865FFD
ILSGELAQQNANQDAFQSVKEARTSYIEMNQRKEDSPFMNEDLRLAISYAIDRNAIVNSVLGDGSVASTGLIPSDMSKNPETNEDFTKEAGDLVSFDKKKAQDHWEKAKKALGKDSFEFDIVASDDDGTKKVLEYLQSTLEETLPGIKIKPTPEPFS